MTYLKFNTQEHVHRFTNFSKVNSGYAVSIL